MNDRITELAKQCDMSLFFIGDGLSINAISGKDIQKFAELIVKECIEINKQELAFNSFEKLLNRYQEHFGVEK